MQRLCGGGAFRRDGAAQHQHRRQVLHRERGGMQQLHRGQHREGRCQRGDAPAQYRCRGGARGQPGRPEPLDQPAPPGEQRDLGDDGFGHQQTDHRIGHALRAPVERGEAVIRGVRALDQRTGQNGQAERTVGEQAQPRECARHGAAGGLGQERCHRGGRTVARRQQPGHQPGAGDGQQPARAGARRHVGDRADGADRPVFHALCACQCKRQ